jgi:serine/threonine-protein kinase RsbW
MEKNGVMFIGHSFFMTVERTEISTSIGGFTPEQVAQMKMREYTHRNNLLVPEPLIEQAIRVKELLQSVCDGVHDAGDRQKFKRGTMMEEALLNAVMHGNRVGNVSDATKLSEIQLVVERGRFDTAQSVSIILMIDDHSPKFDPKSVPDPTLPENLEKPTGRGLLMIRETGHATMAQIPQPFGKTVIYSWNEVTVPPKDGSASEETGNS